MCLTLRENYKKPYNDRNIRWKIVDVKDEVYRAPYQLVRYSKNKWNKCTKGLGERIDGFHVFASRKAARHRLKIMRSIYGSYFSLFILKKVKVKSFMASGTYYHDKCETWEKMKFVND